MKCSVLICTHNPDRKVLRRVLDALASQSLDARQFEVFVVDNGSEPEISAEDVSVGRDVNILKEPKAGKVWAKLRGVEVSVGEYVVIVDDDNILEPAYLATAIGIMDAHPFMGILGGQGVGEFETAPPDWMADYLPVMGVGQRSFEEVGQLQYALTKQLGPWLPIGAGMIIRREVAELYRDWILEDDSHAAYCRTGKRSIFGGTDTDIVMLAINHGWACGQSSKLHYTHVIPGWRLEQDYVLRLLYASNYGTARLLIHHGWKKEQKVSLVSVGKRLRQLLGKIRQRTFEQQCWHAHQKGYRDGISGMPYDESFR